MSPACRFFENFTNKNQFACIFKNICANIYIYSSPSWYIGIFFNSLYHRRLNLFSCDFYTDSGFISLYPNPTNDFIRNTEGKGFQTFSDYGNLTTHITEIVNSDRNFFSSMLPKIKLGQIIGIPAKEQDNVSKAEKFLSLIGE